MEPANTKEYFLHLCGHLWDGGEVESTGTDRGTFSLQEVHFSWMAEHPEQRQIVERPMVYVYATKAHPEEHHARATHELNGKSIEEFLSERNRPFELIASFPIEDLK